MTYAVLVLGGAMFGVGIWLLIRSILRSRFEVGS